MRDIRDRYPEDPGARRAAPSATSTPGSAQAAGVTHRTRRILGQRLLRTRGSAMAGEFSAILCDDCGGGGLTRSPPSPRLAARKIREGFNDPGRREKLIPRKPGFGTRRIPPRTLGLLRGLQNSRRQLVTSTRDARSSASPSGGIRIIGTRARVRPILIYATGSMPLPAAFDRIDIRGRRRLGLKAVWKERPEDHSAILADQGFRIVMRWVATPGQQLPRDREYRSNGSPA